MLLTCPIFVFWDSIYVLKLECCNFGLLCVIGSGWAERITVTKIASLVFTKQETYQFRGWIGGGRKALCFPLCVQNEPHTALEEIKEFALHVRF